MSLFRGTPPDEVAAQGVLLALILQGLWALSGTPLRHMARRDAVATGAIALAFVVHRLTLAEFGHGSITEGAERLCYLLSTSWTPYPGTPDHRLVALLALVVPAALLVAAVWTATRPKDAPCPHDRLACAGLRRFLRNA